MKRIRIFIVIVFLSTGLACGQARLVLAAGESTGAQALASLSSGKVVWDINTSSPARLALYLGVIAETYDDLLRQGVKPDMVFAFRGESLRIISSEHEQITLRSMPEIDQSARLIQALLQRPGVRMEACSIAARIAKVDTGKILHGIRPVKNTFVSLIEYQRLGYAMIPID